MPKRSRPLLILALTAAVALVLQTFSHAFVGQAPQGNGRRLDLGLRAAAQLASRIEGLSPEEVKAYKAKALDIWESLKPDILAELSKHQTFRPDLFDSMMKTDSRGKALFELYKPGTPEYAEFFEENMGPFLLELAKEKMKEAGVAVVGVIVVLGTIAAFLAYFGTDVIQGITAPFTGFATEFVELYGF